MTNFRQEFEEYKKACYPPEGKIHNSLQDKEVTQAFYAGAFASMNILIEAMEKDENSIDKFAKDLYRELATVLKPKG